MRISQHFLGNSSALSSEQKPLEPIQKSATLAKASDVQAPADVTMTKHYALTQAQVSVPFVSNAGPMDPLSAQAKASLIERFPDLSLTLQTLSEGVDPVLLQRNRQGETILQQLQQLTQVEGVFPEVSTSAVVRQLVLRLQDRAEIFQGPQFTCGSAAIQNYMTQNQPAEMVSIVGQLATRGKAILQDGSSLKLPKDTQRYLQTQSTHDFNKGVDRDTRETTDVLFQSAVMKDISLVGGDRAWKRNANTWLGEGVKALAWLTDWADYNAQNDDAGLLPKLAGNGGGDPFLIQDLLEGMTGKDFSRASMISKDHLWGDDSRFKGILQGIKRGQNEVLTLLKSPLHYVLLTDYDAESQTVTYLSTGTYPQGSEQASRTEYETVKVSDFLKNCGALYVASEG